MDFIVEHIGIFIGAGVVVVLAVIGYFADKKDTEKRNKENININNNLFDKDSVGDSNNNYASPVMFNELPDVGNGVGLNGIKELDAVNRDFDPIVEVNEQSENSSYGQSIDEVIGSSYEQSNNNVISNSYGQSIDEIVNNSSFSAMTDKSNEDIIDNSSFSTTTNQSNEDIIDIQEEPTNNNESYFVFSNFENTNMSLEDLERRNYENLIAENRNSLNNDNYYYSDLDSNDSNYEQVGSLDSLSSSGNDLEPVSAQMLSNEMDSSVSSVVSQDDMIQQEVTDNSHEFDNESLGSSSENVQNENSFVNIPEVQSIDDSGNGASFESESAPTFDDIWKF